MALVNLESYSSANAVAGVDLIPSIRQNINTTKKVNLSENVQLRSMTIYAKPGDIFTINGFDFETNSEGSFSTPIAINVDYISITSIVPKQSGEVRIYYLR